MWHFLNSSIQVDHDREHANVLIETRDVSAMMFPSIDKADIALLIDDLRAVLDDLEKTYKHMDFINE